MAVENGTFENLHLLSRLSTDNVSRLTHPLHLHLHPDLHLHLDLSTEVYARKPSACRLSSLSALPGQSLNRPSPFARHALRRLRRVAQGAGV